MPWTGSSSGWTALDFGDPGHWRAISLRPGRRGDGRPRVTAVAEVAATDGGDPRQALKALLAGVEKRLPVIVTLARSQYRVRVMNEPMVPAREMATTLKWAMAAEADHPLDEFNLAWLSIPSDEAVQARRQAQLYAITVDSGWLATQQSLWREAGLRPKVLDIRETAYRNLAALRERRGEGLVMLYAEDQGVGFVFTRGGTLYMDRFIEQPSRDLAQAPPDALLRLHERVAAEVSRSIDVVGRTHPSMAISHVALAPLPGRGGLAAVLAQQLRVAVEPLALEGLFDLSEVPALARDEALQSRCLVALGTCLRGLSVVPRLEAA